MERQYDSSEADDSEDLVCELFQAMMDWEPVKFISLFSAASSTLQYKLAHSTYRDSLDGKTLLIQAVEFNQLELCNFLLKHGADVDMGHAFYNKTPLHFAADDKIDLEIMKLLLVNGANPNIRDNKRRTALHDVCCSNQPEKAEILLKHHADANVQTHSGD